MPFAETIARRIADGIAVLNCACSCDGAVVEVPKWGLKVVVRDAEVRQEPDRCQIQTEIHAFHPWLPQGWVRELSVTLGRTPQQCADEIAATWVLLVFEPMRLLFESAHTCFVKQASVELPGASQPYVLLAGPVQTRGFDEGAERPGGLSQTLCWERVADVIGPALGPGVHHLRCFAARWEGATEADVFVDGEQSPDASERLTELATTLPPVTQASPPLYSIKQHLFLRPADPERGRAEEEAWQLERWKTAIGDHLEPEHRPLLRDVLRGIYVCGRLRGSEDEAYDALRVRGVSEAVADELVMFLQSAAARVFLEGKVEFAETYFLTNEETRRAMERRYDQTPVFVAALRAAQCLREAKQAERELWSIAACSAEVNAYSRAIAQGSQGPLRFNPMIHHTRRPVDGVDVDALLETTPSHLPRTERRRPWWKWW